MEDLFPRGQSQVDISKLGRVQSVSKPDTLLLRPGLIVVKGFLTPVEQQELVDCTRTLGLGPGGFYRPSYGNRGKQQLFMVGLIIAAR